MGQSLSGPRLEDVDATTHAMMPSTWQRAGRKRKAQKELDPLQVYREYIALIPSGGTTLTQSDRMNEAPSTIEDLGKLSLEAPDTTQSPFPFLDLPRELRDKVYQELVTINRNHDDNIFPLEKWSAAEWPRNFSGLNLLSVNRQVRKEAWEMLKDGNIWIQIRLCGPPSQFQCILSADFLHNDKGKRASQGVFTTYGYPPDSIRHLRESSIITVCLGGKDGVKAEDKLLEANFKGMVLLLPYHPSLWSLVISRLSMQMDPQHHAFPHRRSIHITCRNNVLQDTSNSGRAFEKITKCLFMVRDAVNASASGCGDALDGLVSKMQSPIRCDVDVIKCGLEFQKMGDEYSKKDYHYAALRYYLYGLSAMRYHIKVGHAKQGSLPQIHQHLTVRNIQAELNCSISQVANEIMIQQIRLKKEACSDEVKLKLITRSKKYATDALWVGATDQLRRRAHWELSRAHMLLATLDDELFKSVGSSNSEYSHKAVEQLRYALELDNPIDPYLTSFRNDPLYRSLFEDLKVPRDPRTPLPLWKVKIPALEPWIRDPSLLRKWGSDAAMMRFYRQRAWPSLGETMGEDELKSLYSRYKIEWDRDGKGGYTFRGAYLESWTRQLSPLLDKRFQQEG
ncbi:hypothetical protein E8E14_001566 [Neopestalotiopsis sp. 37M]|nr:hypothetical protein E8E14_001566 [Neopestalotiopsis sp. 37M]